MSDKIFVVIAFIVSVLPGLIIIVFFNPWTEIWTKNLFKAKCPDCNCRGEKVESRPWYSVWYCKECNKPFSTHP